MHWDVADADTCLPPLLAQLIKLYRTKSAADLSYFYLALYSLGLFFITVYVRRAPALLLAFLAARAGMWKCMCTAAPPSLTAH